MVASLSRLANAEAGSVATTTLPPAPLRVPRWCENAHLGDASEPEFPYPRLTWPGTGLRSPQNGGGHDARGTEGPVRGDVPLGGRSGDGRGAAMLPAPRDTRVARVARGRRARRAQGARRLRPGGTALGRTRRAAALLGDRLARGSARRHLPDRRHRARGALPRAGQHVLAAPGDLP